MKTISNNPKKPYVKPTLRVYGGIKDLTKTNVTTKVNDGGGGHIANKTG